MYDVEKLVSVVCDYLDAEADYKKYSLDVRKELGLAPDSTLWIPSLNGSKAYRLGELSEKSGATGSILADICAMLDINQELLVAAVKSMQRKERHNGRWDNPNYTCWMNEDDKKRLARFLSNEKGEFGVHPWFSSTGMKQLKSLSAVETGAARSLYILRAEQLDVISGKLRAAIEAGDKRIEIKY